MKPGSKPFNAAYYPVPNIRKETFHKDLQHLADIGVLTPVQKSQYGTPILIIIKKEGTVRFISDYRNINQIIIRKPRPLPIVGDIMKKLEGLKYSTAFNLNAGY